MAEEIVIKTRVEGGEAIASVDKINQGLKDIEKQADKTSVKVGKAMKGFSESTEAVTGAYVGLQSAMLLANQDSEEMAKIMSKIIAVQSAFNAVKMVGNSLMMENNIITRTSTALTAIYAGVQKAITVATNGTNVAMKALRLAMLALPVLLIIAGLTALVMWLVSTSKASKELEESNNATTASYEKLTKATKDFNDQQVRDVGNRIKLAQSENATRQEMHELELERLQIMEDARKNDISIELNAINEKRKNYKKALELGNEELAKSIKEEISQHREKYGELKKLDGQFQVDKQVQINKNNSEIAKEEEQAEKTRTDAQKQAWEKQKQARDARLAKEKAQRKEHEADLLAVKRTAEDIAINAIEDDLLRQESALILSYERQKEAIKLKHDENIELVKQLEANSSERQKEAIKLKYSENAEIIKKLEENRNAELEALRLKSSTELKAKENELNQRLSTEELNLKLQSIRAENDAQMQLSLEYIELEFQAVKELREQQKAIELANLELTEQERDLIKEKYRIQELEAEKEKAQKVTAIEKQEQAKRLELQNQAFDALNNLNDLVFTLASNRAKEGSKEEEKQARAKFKISKALQLTQATITGVQSVMNAFNSGLAVPILGPVTGAIYATMAGVNAAANIAKIASTKFDPSGGGSSGGGSIGSSIPAPNVADAGAGTFNPGGDFPKMTDVNSTNDRNSVKVVLTDSDLKAGQKNSTKIDLISKG
jgi:hypothetical protein